MSVELNARVSLGPKVKEATKTALGLPWRIIHVLVV